eukprot:2058049-Rhodomonas_salina.2
MELRVKGLGAYRSFLSGSDASSFSARTAVPVQYRRAPVQYRRAPATVAVPPYARSGPDIA